MGNPAVIDVAHVIESVVEMLESAQQRPAMYFTQHTFYGAEDFLTGVACAMHSLHPLPTTRARRNEAMQSRGYDTQISSLNELESQVRARHSDEWDVVRELFAIEIDAWKLALQSVRSASKTQFG